MNDKLWRWIPLALAIAGAAVAWGQQQAEMHDLAKRVERLETNQVKINEIEGRQGRIDERLIAVQQRVERLEDAAGRQ